MKISITVKDTLSSKLKSQLYGLLCEYEKDRDWEAFLDSIIIELMGYPEEDSSVHLRIYTVYTVDTVCKSLVRKKIVMNG